MKNKAPHPTLSIYNNAPTSMTQAYKSACILCLERSNARLLIDSTVSLLLFAVLQKHGSCEDENYVNTDNTEGTSKNDIEEDISIFREWCHTADLGCSGEGIWAG